MNPEALELKEKANECMKQEKFVEAMLHYTRSIKLESDNPTCYTNRSLAFLKLSQYHYALEDAKTAIRLMPKWTKGYYRKGEVEKITEHYEDAMQSYQKALAIDPQDETLQKCLKSATESFKQQRRKENRLPYYGAAAGVLIGLIIVLADEHLTKTPSISYGGVQLLLIVTLVLLGLGCSLIYRFFIRNQRSELIAPPAQLFPDEGPTPGFPGTAPKTTQPDPTKQTTSHRRKHKS